MLTIILGYILIGLVPLLCVYRKYKTLTIIALLSEYTESFAIILGNFKFTADVYIGFVVIIVNLRFFIKEKTKIGIFLWIEYYWVIGIGFLFLCFPWQDSVIQFRTWTQAQTGRTLVGIVRMIEPILVFYLFFFLFFTQKISLRFFLTLLCFLAIGSVIIGILDVYFVEGFIKLQFHLSDRNILLDRFTGLFLEPRYLARMLGITLIILLCLKDSIQDKQRQILFGITLLACVLGIGMTYSSSAIGATLFAFVVYLFVFKITFQKITIYLIIIALSIGILLQNENFISHTSARLSFILVEEEDREIPDVPSVISSLETFDASALAFFYKNPKHLIWGVGPNTICIPANDYMSPYAQKIYDYLLNNPPYTFLLCYFSRSGIVGVICYCLIFSLLAFYLWKYNPTYSKFIIVCFAFFFISCNNFNIIFAILGIMSAAYEQAQRVSDKHLSEQWI